MTRARPADISKANVSAARPLGGEPAALTPERFFIRTCCGTTNAILPSTDSHYSPFSSTPPHTLGSLHTLIRWENTVTGQNRQKRDPLSQRTCPCTPPCPSLPQGCRPPRSLCRDRREAPRLANCHGGPPSAGGSGTSASVPIMAGRRPGAEGRASPRRLPGCRGRRLPWCREAPAAMALPSPPPARVFAELLPAPVPAPAPAPSGREVHVSGSAELSAGPDRARVSLRLGSRKEAAGAARSSVARRLEYIAQSARQRGVPVRAAARRREAGRQAGRRGGGSSVAPGSERGKPGWGSPVRGKAGSRGVTGPGAAVTARLRRGGGRVGSPCGKGGTWPVGALRRVGPSASENRPASTVGPAGVVRPPHGLASLHPRVRGSGGVTVGLPQRSNRRLRSFFLFSSL